VWVTQVVFTRSVQDRRLLIARRPANCTAMKPRIQCVLAP
jgi:hypothetical protein